LVPEILIAELKIFCGSPGARITYGDLIKNAAKIKIARSNFVGPGICDLTGSNDLIYYLFFGLNDFWKFLNLLTDLLVWLSNLDLYLLSHTPYKIAQKTAPIGIAHQINAESGAEFIGISY
jgi:hypothetical protein